MMNVNELHSLYCRSSLPADRENDYHISNPPSSPRVAHPAARRVSRADVRVRGGTWLPSGLQRELRSTCGPTWNKHKHTNIHKHTYTRADTHKQRRKHVQHSRQTRPMSRWGSLQLLKVICTVLHTSDWGKRVKFPTLTLTWLTPPSYIPMSTRCTLVKKCVSKLLRGATPSLPSDRKSVV